MPDPQVKPIVKMQEDGSGASIVSYNVPEPTTYFGNKYFEIDLEDLVQRDEQFAGVDWRTLFKEFANLPFTGRASAITLLQTLREGGTLQTSIEQILNHGYNHKKIGEDLTPLDLISKFFYLPSNFEGLEKVGRNIENELLGCSRLMQNRAFVATRENNLLLNRTINIRDSIVLNRLLVRIILMEEDQKVNLLLPMKFFLLMTNGKLLLENTCLIWEHLRTRS